MSIFTQAKIQHYSARHAIPRGQMAARQDA